MKIRGFEIVKDEMRKNKDGEVLLPLRGTKISAGYDFYTPIDIKLKPNEKVTVWSDIKAYMQEGEVLMVYVRSSMGIKKGLALANGTGIIDSDYYSNESDDGNIGICVVNTSDKEIYIKKGDRIAQGIFLPFLVSDNCNSNKERKGGIGHTGK